MQGNASSEGNLVITGTVSEGLPAGILHITLPGYGYYIDQSIELQDDQGAGVRVGPLTVTSIQVTGENIITIPGSNTVTATYEAIVKDQYDAVMGEESVNWSVVDVNGTDVNDGKVSIDANTGIVTVTSETTAQANSFKLIATSASDSAISCELTISLTEVTVSALDYDYYAAGDTLTFTISGLRPLEENIIVHMPIVLIEGGRASDLLVLDEMVDDQGVTYMQGNASSEGGLVITGTVSEGLPAGILHITLPGYGYYIDQSIELQDDQGAGVRVGPI